MKQPCPSGGAVSFCRFLKCWFRGYKRAKMTRMIRTYIALLLSAMLTFTGQSMAVARGMPGPDGRIELCTGHGPVMVYVDADGQPVSAPHLCPDGALSLIQTGFDAPDVSFTAAPAPRKLRFHIAHSPDVGHKGRIAQARDPPVSEHSRSSH